MSRIEPMPAEGQPSARTAFVYFDFVFSSLQQTNVQRHTLLPWLVYASIVTTTHGDSVSIIILHFYNATVGGEQRTTEVAPCTGCC